MGPAVVEDVSMIPVHGFSLENRNEGKAFVGLGFLTFEFLRVGGSRKFQTSCHQVNHVTALLGDAAGLGLESGRPMNDGGRAGSPLWTLDL